MQFGKKDNTGKLLSAIRCNDRHEITKILKRPASVFGGESSSFGQVLLYAAEKNDQQTVQRITEAGSRKWDNNLKVAGLALCKAAEKDCEETAAYLIGIGADVYTLDGDGVFPMDYSARNGNIQIIRMLTAAGADVNHKPENGGFALNSAVFHGHAECVKYLISAGADVCSANNYGKSPIHWAAQKGYDQIAEILIKAGADVNAVQEDGSVPLNCSAAHGHAGVTKILIKAGADINAKDNDGYTPLHSAAWQGYAKIAEILIKAGAKLDTVNNDNNTPYRMAVQHQQRETVSVFLQALGPPDDSRTANAVADLIDDSEQVVREAALDVLKGMKALAAQALAPKMWHPDEEIQKRASEWLEHFTLPKDAEIGRRYESLGGSWKNVTAFDRLSVYFLLSALFDRLYYTDSDYGLRDSNEDIISTLGRAYEWVDADDRKRIFSVMLKCLENEAVYIADSAADVLVRHVHETGLDEMYRLLLQDRPEMQKVIVRAFRNTKNHRAAELLLEAFDKVHPETAVLISGTLAGSGDPRVFGPVLAFIFDKTPFIGEGYDILLKDYYSVIHTLLCGLDCRTTETGGEYTNYFYEYDARRIKEAIKELCTMKTPVSDNLLHFASELKDKEVTVAWGWNISSPVKETISMEEVRSAARAELILRGNPPYDEAHYLAKDAWKI